MFEWLTSKLRRKPAHRRYQTVPGWSQRRFEAAETNRLNEAHWQWAIQDYDINWWLREQLTTIRSRAIYETRNNGFLQGIVNTLVDDVVGPDGPTLQVLSDDPAYNDSLEAVWRDWFAAPCFKPGVSGTSLLKLWVRNLPRCGEFLAWIDTDNRAEGPVAMRLRPIHPRRLAAPTDQIANPLNVLGVEFDTDERPTRYWIQCTHGKAFASGAPVAYVPVPPDLIIHEFIVDEEGQARGFPWFVSALQPAADLRDYDDQIQDAARQSADSASMLYTDNPDVPVWSTPEETTIERRSVKMCPPGWKPWQYSSSQPPAQYPDFRSERQREFGRPIGMPLLMVRLDSSRHNYSSARLDTQTYNRTVQGIQNWLSGTPRSRGTLSRLVDLVAQEARFSVRELRRRPQLVEYVWTWPPRPHVDPTKETAAETESLTNRTQSFSAALAARGTNLDTHLRTLQREEEAIATAGVAVPPWLRSLPQPRATPATASADLAAAVTDAMEEVNADE
jgi:capsid protein